MNEDVEAFAQKRADGLTCRRPCLLECVVGNRHVDNWEVEPLHVPVDDPLSQMRNHEIIKLELLDEGQNRSGIPFGYGVEVGFEVPIPRAGRALELLLARTEADTQRTQAMTEVDSRNLQWM